MASILILGRPTHVHGALRVAWRAGRTPSTPAVATTATFLLWPPCFHRTHHMWRRDMDGGRDSHLVHTALISLATIFTGLTCTSFSLLALICGDPKLMCLWIPSFLPPGFPSTRCPVYVDRSVHGDQTIICSTLCSIKSEVMTCTGGAVHFRSVIAKLGPQNSFRGVFLYYTRHFSCCQLGVWGGWGAGGSCSTEKPVNQTHPSGGWQGH